MKVTILINLLVRVISWQCELQRCWLPPRSIHCLLLLRNVKKSCNVFGEVWKSKLSKKVLMSRLSKSIKKHLFQAAIESVLLYGAATLTITNKIQNSYVLKDAKICFQGQLDRKMTNLELFPQGGWQELGKKVKQIKCYDLSAGTHESFCDRIKSEPHEVRNCILGCFHVRKCLRFLWNIVSVFLSVGKWPT